MSDCPWHQKATQQALTLQIIVASLVMGCLVFLGVVLTLGPREGEIPFPMAWIAMGFAGVMVVVRFVVVGAITSVHRKAIGRGDCAPADGASPRPASPPGDLPETERTEREAESLLMVFQVRTIVGAAMLEGAAFFALVLNMMGRDPTLLALAVLLIVGVALHLPTRSRLIHWVENQMEILNRERLFAG